MRGCPRSTSFAGRADVRVLPASYPASASGIIVRMDTNSLLRGLPKTDEVLGDAQLADALRDLPRPLVVDAVRDVIDDARARILNGGVDAYTVADAARDAAARAALSARPNL
ncbi:MAG: hypothetical protein FDZ75_03645, partial [Actinobacteria bacterium]